MRLQVVLARELVADDDRRRSAVIDARRVAGSDRAAFAERRPQLAQCLHRGVGPGMLVARDLDGLALGLRHHHRHDLVREAALFDGRDGTLV